MEANRERDSDLGLPTKGGPEPVVQLRCSPLPGPLAAFGLHPYYVAWDPAAQAWRRWEVWQNVIGDSGHLIEGLSEDLGDGATGNPPWVEAEWRGAEAARLLAVLRRSPETYPYCETYHYVPGPNSNTFAGWVLREAEVAWELPPRAVGKDFVLFDVGQSASRTGLHLDTFLGGVALGLGDGLELHSLGFTWGLDVWPLALKTPCGRLGWAETRPRRGCACGNLPQAVRGAPGACHLH